MSSGSYFTIYRKHLKDKASQDVIDALKNEYYVANKNEMFNDKQNEEELKNDLPLLMHSCFKANSIDYENRNSNVYFNLDGTKYEKLLEFHFCSSFSCLKDHFMLNPYKFSAASTFISKHDAEKILQAIEYVLSEDYSKSFEHILNNEYVTLFGNGYSPFDNRFKNSINPIYIDKDDDNRYTVQFNDQYYDAEINESNDDVIFNLNRVRACLLAYLNAEDNSYYDEELVLEYSVYG